MQHSVSQAIVEKDVFIMPEERDNKKNNKHKSKDKENENGKKKLLDNCSKMKTTDQKNKFCIQHFRVSSVATEKCKVRIFS